MDQHWSCLPGKLKNERCLEDREKRDVAEHRWTEGRRMKGIEDGAEQWEGREKEVKDCESEVEREREPVRRRRKRTKGTEEETEMIEEGRRTGQKRDMKI